MIEVGTYDGVYTFEPVRVRTQEILSVLAKPETSGLVVDMSNCGFLCGAHITGLATLFAQAKRVGKPFAVCGGNSDFHEVFKLHRLEKIIRHFPDRETAIKALSGVAERITGNRHEQVSQGVLHVRGHGVRVGGVRRQVEQYLRIGTASVLCSNSGCRDLRPEARSRPPNNRKVGIA